MPVPGWGTLGSLMLHGTVEKEVLGRRGKCAQKTALRGESEIFSPRGLASFCVARIYRPKVTSAVFRIYPEGSSSGVLRHSR